MNLKPWGNLELEQEMPSNQESAVNSRKEVEGRRLVPYFCDANVCKVLGRKGATYREDWKGKVLLECACGVAQSVVIRSQGGTE